MTHFEKSNNTKVSIAIDTACCRSFLCQLCMCKGVKIFESIYIYISIYLYIYISNRMIIYNGTRPFI